MCQDDGPSAKQLLQKAKQGETEALGQLLDAYRSFLSLLARMSLPIELRPKIDPSDVVQEACLQAHRGFPQFRGATESAFLNWLKAILINELAAQRRRFLKNSGRNAHREVDLRSVIDRSSMTLSQAALSHDPSPSDNLRHFERGVVLANALAKLSPDHREIIVLRNLEERPFNDIAVAMDRSPESVRSLWVRAVRNLVKELNWNDGSSIV